MEKALSDGMTAVPVIRVTCRGAEIPALRRVTDVGCSLYATAAGWSVERLTLREEALNRRAARSVS
jgi:hypothetical protein